MELILMRHAETESGASYAEDSLRPLIENGRNTQRLVGQNMCKLNIRPDAVLCSPRLRAQQTAEITVDELEVDPVIETEQILDGSYSTEHLLNLLSKRMSGLPSDCTILCVGHVPDMGIWMDALLRDACDLSAGSDSKFKTSSFAHLVFDGAPVLGKGELEGFYRADML